MKTIDDRTAEQMKSHNVLVTATDRFMSGWGGAEGGLSKVAWACQEKDAEKIFKWVKNRSEMKYVNIHYHNWQVKNAAHVHIYVVNDNHPALK